MEGTYDIPYKTDYWTKSDEIHVEMQIISHNPKPHLDWFTILNVIDAESPGGTSIGRSR